LFVRTEGEKSIMFSFNNLLAGFSNVTLLVFLGGPSLPKGVAIVPGSTKVLNDFKTEIFEVDLLIIITSVRFQTYQVLAFASYRRSTKFEYSYDFPSCFRYFTRLFVVTTGKVLRIVLNIGFDLANVEGIVGKKKSTVH